MTLDQFVANVTEKHLKNKGGLPRLAALNNRRYRCICIWQERARRKEIGTYCGMTVVLDPTLPPNSFKLEP